MVTKKDEAALETVEATETTPAAEVPAETATAAPAANGPAVVGAIEDPSKMSVEHANICIECGAVWPIDKGVASCGACGGKTVRGFKHQKSSLVASDNARFTGDSAVNPKAE